MNNSPELLKILLLHEQTAVAKLITLMLHSAANFPFQLWQVTDIEAAIAQQNITPVDVVLLEISQPQGIVAVEQLHRVAPRVPIVLVCDLKAEAITQQALLQGAQEYLVKEQITVQLLTRVIRYTIEQQNWSQALQQTQQALQQQIASCQLLAKIASNIRQSLDLPDILQTTVAEVRQFLQTDRVMIYRIRPDQSGVLVAESVAPGCHVAPEVAESHRTWFKPADVEWNTECLWVVDDIYQQAYSPTQLELMIQLGITAKLVVPIVHNQQLWGLLAVHQCHEPRQWQVKEIELLKQIAIQAAIAIQQSELYEQVKLLNANLEAQVQERTQQLTAEKALTEQILNSIQEAIFVVRPNGELVLAKPATPPLFESGDRQFPTQPNQLHNFFANFQARNPDGSVVPPETLPMARALRGEAFSDQQLVVVDPSGEQKWLSVSGTAVRDQLGKVVMAVHTARDITAAKQAEAALRASASHLRRHSQTLMELASYNPLDWSNLPIALEKITKAAIRTLEVARVSVWLYNSDRTWLTCVNRSTNQERLVADYPTYFQTLQQQRTLAVDNAFHDCRTQELTDYYLRLGIASTLDASIWLEGQMVGVVLHEHIGSVRQWSLEEQNFAGSIADFVSLALEANQRQQIEAGLQQSEARYQAIFDCTSIGIAPADLQGRLLDANPALTEILGYSREELLGMYFADYTYPEDVAADLELFQSLATGNREHYTLEKRFVHQTGQLIWGRLAVSLVRDCHGKPQFAIGMIEDITEHKAAEIQLRDSKEAAEAGSRAKSEFLAIMSHELRTPLNTILGLAQLLQQEIFGTLNPKQTQYIDCIQTSGEHLLALINDILDLSKVEAGREELFLAPIDVSELCNYCLQVISDRARAKGLQLTSQIAPTVSICIADERRVRQMLLNLLSNAIKFTDRGTVSLSVAPVPGGIAFKVLDTGIGIAPAQLKLLFQPFKQLDSQLTRQYEGTGLGLALTQKLAQLHGGEVTVQSTLGVGSQFTLVLPSALDEYPVFNRSSS